MFFIDFRVAVTPAVTATLIKKGFVVNVEEGAGLEAKFRNEEYLEAGAKLVNTSDTFKSSEYSVKMTTTIARKMTWDVMCK